MAEFTPITIAYGDGIGPEIMDAVLYILRQAEARISLETIEVGEKLYKKHYTSGISEESWNVIQRTGIILKAPITTPQSGGYKSLNVTIRKTLQLFANIRPAVSFHPFTRTLHPNLNLTIIRENEEDLYSGIEYRQTHNMYESLKLISHTGCKKIIRYAFEYAVKNNRKKVTCLSKDNIMKFSDGIFHRVFNEIAKEYPQIDNEHYIIDIGTAKLATTPEIFDIIVTSNLYGDIISDVAAEISGSVGLAGSANIGQHYAMFEAVHGSAPDIAGKGIANPSGLLNAAIMMLVHIGQGDIASLIENAWKKTIEDGVHTFDIYSEHSSSKKVCTKEFAEEVIKRLGQLPMTLPKASYPLIVKKQESKIEYKIDTTEVKKLVGTDIFINIHVFSAHDIADKINKLDIGNFELKTISSKGLKLWPHDLRFEIISDHWCCRFMNKDGTEIKHLDIIILLQALSKANIDFIKVENLFEFDGVACYSLAQGE
ncbi:NADP-dependent isocitrate dehydrogenase [Rickettsia typhi]|uniref:Isocitrate dehydrogenase [NADP] n=2 Tax=Rickettsia typhi TaxID=785 RepID=IDH_RICTY|nr:NADP-dependent isocitrate dehydrogenase [Rickettsia typhi]Q68XA5.1 RecName: Full=Isocitrate dehydrogenase [NADP]; Short=IDH; AltName: Full=IDP; AltName: Full=NADP(+)-specific ICDH; AltName: Full=Oxalosuccinate decarboxylase [Rickettsia typhi str. Wilmington]AAU03737.1 IDH [Rickettsia typhi str. Wilmington]AFE54114.1 isocitrate dehydrogenase [Rickettsia typhi str. TH1527]AFE54953.1 isocitrate dehydrogenase [Rickettsia typhi str. B9991CWPP]